MGGNPPTEPEGTLKTPASGLHGTKPPSKGEMRMELLKEMPYGQEERYLWNGDLLHIPQQFLRGHLHFVEGKPALAEVFQ